MRRELFTIKNILRPIFSVCHNITTMKSVEKNEWSVAQFRQIFYGFCVGDVGRIFDFSIYCYVIFSWHLNEKESTKKSLRLFSIQFRFYISKYYWFLSFNYTIIDSLIFSWFSCLCRMSCCCFWAVCCCPAIYKSNHNVEKKLSEEKLREK